jgi:glyoxylase I family protein
VSGFPGVSGAHHVALTVTDLERSLAWWQRVFDLEVLFREDGETRRAVVLRFGGTGFLLGLVQHGEPEGGRFSPRRTGLDHLALTTAARAELDSWTEHLDALAVPHSGVVDIPAGAILNLADPDGIAVALFWDSPA